MQLDLLFEGSQEDQSVVGIVGPPGTGKTALATEYAARHGDRYTRVLFLRASDGQAQLARALDGTRPGRILVILDAAYTVDDILPKLKRLLRRPNTHVIVTSTYYMDEKLVPDQLSLGSLSHTDAIAFLQNELPGVHKETLDRLAAIAGGFPLALRLVAGSYKHGDLDSEEVINTLRASLARISSDEPGGSESAMWLAESYLNRFARSASLNDAFEADRVLRRVINEAPDKPDVVRARSLLGALLSKQHQLTGQPGLLEESIVLLRRALDETPPSHPDRPAMQSNLATALRAMAEQTGQPGLLEESIVLLRRALDETPPSHPDRPAMQSNLDRASLRLQVTLSEFPMPWIQRRSMRGRQESLDD